jgi:hypothetical protein
MSKQTIIITLKNYPRPLEVFGEHAAVPASGAGEVSSELFLKEDREAALRHGIAAGASAPPRKPSAR